VARRQTRRCLRVLRGRYQGRGPAPVLLERRQSGERAHPYGHVHRQHRAAPRHSWRTAAQGSGRDRAGGIHHAKQRRLDHARQTPELTACDNNAGRDDRAGPAAGSERLLSNRSADLRCASSSDADAPIPDLPAPDQKGRFKLILAGVAVKDTALGPLRATNWPHRPSGISMSNTSRRRGCLHDHPAARHQSPVHDRDGNQNTPHWPRLNPRFLT
jgi:hypothetical protein